MTDYGNDLHLARLTPEFQRFQAALGWRIKTTENWAPFARLVALFGWSKVCRACEACEPGHRFPSDLERVCIQFKKDEAEASAPRPAPPPVPRDRHAAASLFAQIRARVMEEK